MKIAVIGDLHLPHTDSAPQRDFWLWAKKDIIDSKSDALVVVGDISANGNIAAIRRFLVDLKDFTGKKLLIRGNSDLRTNADEVEKLLPDYAEATLGEYRLIAVDYGTG